MNTPCVRLPSGVPLLLEPRSDLPLAHVFLRFRGGASRDPEGAEGTGELVTRMLRRGTRRRSADAIEARIDWLGALVDEDLDHDGLDLEAEVLTPDLREALELLFELAFEPKFDDREIEKARDLLLEDIKATFDEPEEIADLAFAREFYAPHPYHRPIWGTVESVRSIDRSDLVAFHEQQVRCDELVVAVGGNFGSLDVVATVERLVARYASPGGASRFVTSRGVDPASPPPRPVSSGRVVAVHRAGFEQTQLRIGGPGVAVADPAIDTIEIANLIVGGGYTSRLMQELRIRRGLCYDIGSSFDAGLAPGAFVIDTSTKHENAADAVRTIRGILEQFRDEGPDDQEVERAIRYRLGMFAFEIETSEAVLEERLDMAFFGLPDDYLTRYRERVGAITRDDVIDVSRRHFPLDRLLVVAVTDLRKTGESLAALGRVEALDARTFQPIDGP